MTETTDALVLDLVEWIGREPRLYSEVIETWRTSCPRLTIWEDAVDRGYVARQPAPAAAYASRSPKAAPNSCASTAAAAEAPSHSRARRPAPLTCAGDPPKFMQSHLSCDRNNDIPHSRIAP